MTATRVQMTDEIARSAGKDAANRQMRDAGRAKWSLEDLNLAAQTYNKLTNNASALLPIRGTYWTR